MWILLDPAPIRRGTNTYRLYRCECGLEKVVNSHSIKSERSRMCRKCEGIARRQSDNYLAVSLVHLTYKTNAKKRGLEWALSGVDFLDLTQQYCHYCHVAPSNICVRKHATFVYSGIDRKDNQIGYVLTNCVACCKQCNMAKRDVDYITFMGWIRRLAEAQCLISK